MEEYFDMKSMQFLHPLMTFAISYWQSNNLLVSLFSCPSFQNASDLGQHQMKERQTCSIMLSFVSVCIENQGLITHKKIWQTYSKLTFLYSSEKSRLNPFMKAVCAKWIISVRFSCLFTRIKKKWEPDPQIQSTQGRPFICPHKPVMVNAPERFETSNVEEDKEIDGKTFLVNFA